MRELLRAGRVGVGERSGIVGGGVVGLAGEAGGDGVGVEAMVPEPPDEDGDVAVGGVDAFGAGGGDRGEEVGPVDVIGEDEAVIERPAPAGPADGHPAGGEGGGRRGELAGPGGVVGRGRGEHEGACPQLAIRGGSGVGGGWEEDAGFSVGPVQVFDRTVAEDGADGGIEAGKHALGLAEGVAVEEGDLAVVGVGSPPGVDLVEDDLLGLPAVNGEAESALGDEGVAGDGLEGMASGVGPGLVVAGDDPDLATMLDPDLSRTEDVAGWMKRDPDTVAFDGLAEGDGGDGGVVAEPGAEDEQAGLGGEVGTRAPAGVIGVGVGDDGVIDGLPGVDVKVADLAVEAGGCQAQEAAVVHPIIVGAGRSRDRKWGGKICPIGRSGRD